MDTRWTAVNRFCLTSRLRKPHLFVSCVVSLLLFSQLYTWGRKLPTAICPRKSLYKRDGETRQCIPLKPIKRLMTTEIEEVQGKYMENTEKSRENVEFVIRPNIVASTFSKCGTSSDKVKWTLLFLVKSSVTNLERRNRIRSSWGSVKLIDSIRLETVFILGTTDDEAVNKKVAKENQLHGDILQMNLKDTAETVPEKVLAGMQWASQVLPASWLYASVDDDIVVQVSNLVDYLDSLLAPDKADINSKYFPLRPCYEDLPLICIYQYKVGDIPARKPTSKWYISEKDFPGHTWPRYCRGGLYVMPVQMVKRIFERAKRTSYLYLDDVWITGFMRRKLGEQDCNIMPAPYSQSPDGGFSKLFYYTGGSSALMKHLWGNIKGSPVDVESSITKVWDSWKDNVLAHDVCVEK